MRSFDLSPLYRASVGFDRVADLMDRVLTADITQPSYPPYNIEKTGEHAYRISFAVAGFAPEDLSVEVKEGSLLVSARRPGEGEDSPRQFLHRGIATRAFERRFALADHMRVAGALHEHGMLHIDLIRELPEALRPRRIEITRTAEAVAPVIEAEAAPKAH